MRIGIREAHLSMTEIDLDGVVSVEEVRLDASSLCIGAGPDRFAQGEVNAAIVIAEASVNRLLAGRQMNGARDLEIAMLAGKLRISGKKMLGPIGVPFSVLAAPEIESGVRVRIDPTRISLVGAPLPNLSLGYLGDWLNQQIAEVFDASKLPIPVRLTGLTVEPGRITLTGVTRLDMRPGDLSIVRVAEP